MWNLLLLSISVKDFLEKREEGNFTLSPPILSPSGVIEDRRS